MADHAEAARKPAAAPRADDSPGSGTRHAINRSAAVQLLGETGEALNARPALVAQRALADRLSDGAGGAHGGLPAQLRAGIESLSGISMDDVRVHRNSGKPAQLQAHAYAQGSDIHLAPGQDHHLPHEAWHVVQQKQGRVKATKQMKAGTPVNDDAGLEREADHMGARALSAGKVAAHQMVRDKAAPTDAAVQRRIEFYSEGEGLEKDLRKKVLAVVARLNKEVLWATGILRNDPTLSAEKSLARMGYVKPWVTAFNSLTNTSKLPAFFYARYGYAVEALSSSRMPKQYQGLKILTQYTAGATRPDFVVTHEGEQIAWLDITASASAGHIRNKQHSGWGSRPVVAEVLYTMPGVNSFSKKGLTEEQKKSLSDITKKAEQDAEDFDTGEEHLAVVVEEAIDAAAGKTQISAGAAAIAIRDALVEALAPIHEQTGDISVKDAAGVLRNLGAIRIGKAVSSGSSWASWAFPRAGAAARRGRDIVIEMGAFLRGRRFDVPDHLDVL